MLACWQVEACGAVVVEDAVGKDGARAADYLLSSAKAMKRIRYIKAIAADVPILHWSWVDECLAQAAVVEPTPYLLPLGFSREKKCFVFPDPPLGGGGGGGSVVGSPGGVVTTPAGGIGSKRARRASGSVALEAVKSL